MSKEKTMAKIGKLFMYVIYLIAFISLALEIILRIYNPIPFRIKGDRIVLPINQSYSFVNQYPCFDSLIIHKKNSLGFRGEEKPTNWAKTTSILAVGGSTTECFFISDDKAWPQVMQSELRKSNPAIWVNNAGLNGHSTFGHLLLMRDIVVKLKPTYVYFLTGVNDMDRQDLNEFDTKMVRGKFVQMQQQSFLKNLGHTLANNSEFANLIFNLSKAVKARNQQIFIDKMVALNPKDTLILDPMFVEKTLSDQKKLLPAYAKRLLELVQVAKQHNIRPVMITQPLLYGEGIDPVTKTDLARYRISDQMNGALYWAKLSLYNDVMRRVCAENQIPLIDLAKLLPKSSVYFYDAMHYTNAGSIRVGEILAKESKAFLH